MSMDSIALFTFLWILIYVVTPGTLVWGWKRCVVRGLPRTAMSILSFVALLLATGSATLGLITFLYAQIHHFGFYDPLLMRIEKWGAILSLTAAAFGFAGAWGKSAIRWQAPVCAIGTLCFWVMAAAWE
jgi:hypothetical protein